MHTTYLLKRYIMVAALTMVALAVLTVAMQAFVGVQIGGATGIVAAIVPAIDAGQTFAKRWEKRPENGYAWKLAAAFVMLNFAVGLVFLVVASAVLGDIAMLQSVIVRLGVPFILLILLAVFLVYWCASRYFFGFGAKQQVRAQQTR